MTMETTTIDAFRQRGKSLHGLSDGKHTCKHSFSRGLPDAVRPLILCAVIV